MTRKDTGNFGREGLSRPTPLPFLQECHATGTSVGDLLELKSIGQLFKDSHGQGRAPLRVATVKSNIGHGGSGHISFQLHPCLRERHFHHPFASISASGQPIQTPPRCRDKKQ
jgi:hypothetical protein